MAKVIGNNQVQLDSGKVITPQTGGWYDGMQYWNGTLSQPGQINTLSNQQGAGQLVSKEVIAQTDPKNVAYIEAQRAKMKLAPSPTSGVPQPTATDTTTTPSGGAVDMSGFKTPSAIDLPNLYNSLYTSSGITEKEASLRDKEAKYLEAKGKISDNPFLSASMLDQRLKRLQDKYDQETIPLRNEIATKKADIETRLNLETKQFDINSQQARDSLSYFNTLLSAGALDTATGEDLAEITRSTGISSSIIQSAVNSRKNKEKEVDTQVITSEADDGTVTATVINKKTGEIIKSSDLGKIGNKQGTGESDEVPKATELKNSAIISARQGKTYEDMLAFFRQYGMTPKDIYEVYTTVNYYGRKPDNVDPETGEYKK